MRKATWWEKFWFNGDSIDIFVFLKEALKEVKECPEGYYQFVRNCDFSFSYKKKNYRIKMTRYYSVMGSDSCGFTLYQNDKYIGYFHGSSYLTVIDNYLTPLRKKKKRDNDIKYQKRKKQEGRIFVRNL